MAKIRREGDGKCIPFMVSASTIDRCVVTRRSQVDAAVSCTAAQTHDRFQSSGTRLVFDPQQSHTLHADLLRFSHFGVSSRIDRPLQPVLSSDAKALAPNG